jgi:hypothetical protein
LWLAAAAWRDSPPLHSRGTRCVTEAFGSSCLSLVKMAAHHSTVLTSPSQKVRVLFIHFAAKYLSKQEEYQTLKLKQCCGFRIGEHTYHNNIIMMLLDNLRSSPSSSFSSKQRILPPSQHYPDDAHCSSKKRRTTKINVSSW